MLVGCGNCSGFGEVGDNKASLLRYGSSGGSELRADSFIGIDQKRIISARVTTVWIRRGARA